MGTVASFLFLSDTGRKLLLVLAIVAALAVEYHRIWERGYTKGAAEIQDKWDADKKARLHAFTDAMTKYETAKEQAEQNAKERDAERQGRIDDAKQRARALPPADAGMRFPGSAVGVLDAARNSAEAPGPSAESHKSPAQDSTVAIVTQWAVDVIGWYNECRDEVLGLQTFYHALRQAQPEVKP